MRLSRVRLLAIAGFCACAAPAFAQSGSAVAVPPPPPIVAAPPAAAAALQPAPTPAPPGLVQTPVPPANTDNGTAATAAPAAPPPAQSMPISNDWVAGKTAEIGVLDRVDGGIDNLQIPVGGQVTSGDMKINVLACVMRPANEIPDAAIFVDVQSTAANAGPPIFHGWMVRSIPAATVVGDSSETLRVANCT